jgi:hypothetical protein
MSIQSTIYFQYFLRIMGILKSPEKWKRLVQPRKAQDAPGKKAFFAFIPFVSCDLGKKGSIFSLEGLGAGTGQENSTMGGADSFEFHFWLFWNTISHPAMADFRLSSRQTKAFESSKTHRCS